MSTMACSRPGATLRKTAAATTLRTCELGRTRCCCGAKPPLASERHALVCMLQGDRYIDAWILDERLSKKPGKALSDKPFRCRVGAANSSIR